MIGKAAFGNAYNFDRFRWMQEVSVLACPVPGCGYAFLFPCRVASAIAGIFNEHVAPLSCTSDIRHNSQHRWTVEQLADFIDQHDPTPRESANGDIQESQQTATSELCLTR